MYTFRYDRDAHLLIAQFSGYQDSDHPVWEQSVRQLDRDSEQAGVTSVNMLLVSSEQERPDAERRRRIAEVTDSLRAPTAFALVTSSTVLRGVVNVVGWLASNKRYTRAAFANFDDAVRWAEKQSGRSLPVARKLHDELRAGAVAQRVR